ncbi:MAG TPA: hypothetical protein VEW42_03500 [Candidatus Eisenbacteria bacterium]|nr:hypothetical protein [Candidatus Eisenbacteria bacterium]
MARRSRSLPAYITETDGELILEPGKPGFSIGLANGDHVTYRKRKRGEHPDGYRVRVETAEGGVLYIPDASGDRVLVQKPRAEGRPDRY